MAVYITGTLLSMLFSYISVHIGKSYYLNNIAKFLLPKIFIFLSVVPLTFISAVRYYVGGDYESYIYMYNNQSFSVTEPGIAIFVKLLHIISDNPNIFFFATSIFIIVGYYIAFYRESLSPTYSIFIFFTSSGCFFSSLTLIRQHMATVLLLNALSCYHHKKIKLAIILVLIAITFHNSAILVAIVFLIIDVIRISPIKGAVALASSVVITRLITPFLQNMVVLYTSYGAYFDITGNDTLQEKLMIFLSFYILLSSIYTKVKKYDSLRLMFSAALASLMIGFSVSTMFTPANRLMYYYEPVMALYVPEAISRIDRNDVKIVLFICITLAYIMCATIYYNTEWFRIYYQSYRTLWNV